MTPDTQQQAEKFAKHVWVETAEMPRAIVALMPDGTSHVFPIGIGAHEFRAFASQVLSDDEVAKILRNAL